ncbi:MAG: hypothetical protein U5N55_08435 [Cypionkella sp.]|nr:hypothetical protein [Cypionkella sp.]
MKNISLGLFKIPYYSAVYAMTFFLGFTMPWFLYLSHTSLDPLSELGV